MALTAGQQRCVDTLEQPLVVAAGAGSGKTFTLTKRIVNALAHGYVNDIDEICAITFTKKAAGELKSRIKAELRACDLIEQALKVDEAWISTIHGMCARILRAHAIELEIDPAFTVAEGATVSNYLSRAVETVLLEAQASESSPRIDALFDEYAARSTGGFGPSIENMLIQLVSTASSCTNGTDAFVLPGVTLKPALAVAQAVDMVEQLLQEAAQQRESAKRDAWIAETTQHMEAAHAALDEGLDDYTRALEVLAPVKLAKTFGSKEYKQRVDDVKGLYGACIAEVRLGAARPHLELLVELARHALEVFNELKRTDGVLDNNDLLVLAARAIEEHPAIAACYTDKFKLIMVDEFQDTDQMQVDMIARLAGEGARRLCVVGDAQQSIYRFRGADVSVYRRHLESVRSQWDDSVIELSDNFRSHRDVLAFVDRVFEKPDMFGAQFMSLAAGRDEARVKAPFESEAPRIIVQHTTRPWSGVDAQTACMFAAQRIARQFAQFKAQGHSAGEMVVLLGRMTNAGVYAQALRDEGLPCVISGGSVFASTPEASTMRELVHALANPHETQALFNVLTSPLFSLAASDLLHIGGIDGFRRAATFVAAGNEQPGEAGEISNVLSPQLSCAIRVMRSAWSNVGNQPISRIAEQTLAESGWLTRLQERGPEGLASAANLFKAIRMLQAAETTGAFGPLSTMRQFDDALDNSKEAPGALSVSGGDSVRIMTVHASKGLEFPIAAVAEFKDNSAPRSRLLTASVDGSVYLSLDLGRSLEVLGAARSSFESDMQDYVLGEMGGEEEFAAAVAEDAGSVHRRLAMSGFLAAGDEEEAKRLLYVALTRAKEALVISISTRTSGKNPEGIPANAFAGVISALDSTGTGIAPGTSVCDFGGTHAAIVERIALEPDKEEREDGGQPNEGRPAEDRPFLVPAPEDSAVTAHQTPYHPAHKGIFSYSSISDASHEGDVLNDLANAFTTSVDEAWTENVRPGLEGWGSPALHDDASPHETTFETTLAATPVLFGEDFYDADFSQAFDEDRATNLGTAFHRLAQYAVVRRQAGMQLEMPPAQRVQALSCSCNLDGEQQRRLDEALRRWFESDIAHDMASLAHISAEVPFFVAMPTNDAEKDAVAGAMSYLEGEIDLLGFDESGSHAYVVDYKTGGTCDETAEDLRRKHVLQATCYAYAIMMQGASEVDATFVRVERPSARDAMQPQCVRYHFTSKDLPALEHAIAATWDLARAQEK